VVRRLAILVYIAIAIVALAAQVSAAGVPIAYAKLKPSIVRVWAFDAKGRPSKAGTGVIISSGPERSVVLTAAHVIDGAASIKIDVSRQMHDVRAFVTARTSNDLALLRIEKGWLKPVTLTMHGVTEGDTVAVAGYPGTSHSDDLVEAGLAQEPRLLYPGTVSALLQGAKIITIGNIEVEQGMSGGPVFDPATGDVVGIVEAKLPGRHTGVAISVPLVAMSFITAEHVRVAMRSEPVATPEDRATPVPVIRATPVPVIRATPAPIVYQTPAAPAPTPRVVYVPPPSVEPGTPSMNCSHMTIARVSDEGGRVTTSDGATYQISNSYMKWRASDCTSGDSVKACTSRLSNGASASSIENISRYFTAQATLVGQRAAANASCNGHTIVRVANEGSTITTSDGASYRVSTSYMRWRASDWTTGDSVTVCTSRLGDESTAASIENPARYFKLQADLITQGDASSVNCRGSKVFQVSNDGGIVTTIDGASYVVSTSYMKWRAADWTTGESVKVCTSRLGDGSVAASIANPARYFTLQARRR